MKRQKRFFTDTYEKLAGYRKIPGADWLHGENYSGSQRVRFADLCPSAVVPYENTDIYEYGLPIRLEADALSRKIIEERREVIALAERFVLLTAVHAGI